MIKPSIDSRRLAAQAMQIAQDMDKTGVMAVLLIGSAARGSAHAESDLDLAIIGDENLIEQLELTRKDHPHLLITSLPGRDTSYEIAQLRNVEGHCFIIQDQILAKVLKQEKTFDVPDFCMLNLLSESVVLWQSADAPEYTDNIKQIISDRLSEQGPELLNNQDYETFKERILKMCETDQLKWALSDLDELVPKALGLWPFGIGKIGHAKQNKKHLPSSLCNLVGKICRAELEWYHLRSIYDEDELHQHVLGLVKEAFIYMDDWRKAPKLSPIAPKQNKLTAKDFALDI